MSRSCVFIFFAFICFSVFCGTEKNDLNVSVPYESTTIGSVIDNSIDTVVEGSKYIVASAIVSLMNFYAFLKGKAYGTVEWAEKTTKSR